MLCPKCQGSMIPNPRKSQVNHPDWLCNQDNGPCGSTVTKAGRDGQPRVYHNATPAWNPKEPQVVNQSSPTGFAPVSQPKPTLAKPTMVRENTDWDEIGKQKNRSNLMQAVLHGKELDWDILEQAEAWVLTGKTPKKLAEIDGINPADIPF